MIWVRADLFNLSTYNTVTYILRVKQQEGLFQKVFTQLRITNQQSLILISVGLVNDILLKIDNTQK